MKITMVLRNYSDIVRLDVEPATGEDILELWTIVQEMKKAVEKEKNEDIPASSIIGNIEDSQYYIHFIED